MEWFFLWGGAFSGIPGAPAVEPEGPGPERSGVPTLIEVVVRNGFRLSWIERGRLVEVVREGLLGNLLSFPSRVPDTEFGLGRPPGGMDERGRGGLTDVGQDLGDGFWIGQERDEREGHLASGADEREYLVDTGKKGGPS